MPALGANTFSNDVNTEPDLLSSQSVFVSPFAKGETGGYPVTVDRYQHHQNKDEEEIEVLQGDLDDGGPVAGHDLQWRWAGPPTSKAADAVRFSRDEEQLPNPHVNDDLLDKEFAHPSQQQRQQQQQATENPTPHFNDMHQGNQGQYSREMMHTAGDYAAHGTSPEKGDNTQTNQPADPPPEYPSAAAVPTSPSAASRSFEDQPIRGLGGHRELSLDELIAQGERQMREAQAKTAMVKTSSDGAARNPSTHRSPPPAADSPSPRRPRPTAKAPVPTVERNGNSNFDHRMSSIPRKDPPVRHSSDASHSNSNNSSSSGRPPASGSGTPTLSKRSEAGSVGGGSTMGQGCGAGMSGLRVSASGRSSSFATSCWSGGDPEQLEQLSMGVFPAGGAGGGGGKHGEQDETRSELERREFHELEMELLREEEREAAAAEEETLHRERDEMVDGEGGTMSARRGVVLDTPRTMIEDDFWEDERESYGGEEGASARKGSLSEGLGFGTVGEGQRG